MVIGLLICAKVNDLNVLGQNTLVYTITSNLHGGRGGGPDSPKFGRTPQLLRSFMMNRV